MILSMLWQGAGAYDFNLRNAPDFTYVFYATDTPMDQMLNGAYVPENPWLPTNTTNVKFPRYRTDGYNRAHTNFNTNSDYWLINGAYIRLKNIELGYTLSDNLYQETGVSTNVSFMLSGYNLLTFSAIDFIDPEADTGAARLLEVIILL